MYLKGCVMETTYNRHGIPKDINSRNQFVERPNDISQENRQRSKTLTSKAQINERRILI